MATGIVLAYGASKHSAVTKTITTLADVGAGNMAIIIGTSIPNNRQVEVITALEKCHDLIRENNFAKPATSGNYAGAGAALGQNPTFSSTDAPTATPVETQVGISYSDTFNGTPSSTMLLTATVTRLREVLQETVLRQN